MPAQFSVHIDPDDLARRELAAAVPLSELPGRPATPARPGTPGDRSAERSARSARPLTDRAAARSSGRSYAFRRS